MANQQDFLNDLKFMYRQAKPPQKAEAAKNKNADKVEASSELPNAETNKEKDN